MTPIALSGLSTLTADAAPALRRHAAWTLVAGLGLAAVMASVPAPAQAATLSAFVFDGSGNLLVFDAAAGTGGWNGAITEYSDPAAPLVNPLSLTSVVTFTLDAVTQMLSGQFEFTNAADLSSSLFGSLSGAFTNPADTLTSGGQFSLDYTVTGGTGAYAGLQGFGLSFLSFDPNAVTFDNYSEQGLLSVVPEPGTLALVAMCLGLMARGQRQRSSVPLARA